MSTQDQKVLTSTSNSDSRTIKNKRSRKEERENEKKLPSVINRRAEIVSRHIEQGMVAAVFLTSTIQ